MENIQRFNLVVGVILGRLYASFPVPTTLSMGQVAVDVGLCTNPEDPPHQAVEILVAVVSWLREEGFIRSGNPTMWPVSYHAVVLTHKGLGLLSVPESVQSKLSLGEGLADAAKGGFNDGTRQGIAELVKLALSEGGKLVFQTAVQAAMRPY